MKVDHHNLLWDNWLLKKQTKMTNQPQYCADGVIISAFKLLSTGEGESLSILVFLWRILYILRISSIYSEILFI